MKLKKLEKENIIKTEGLIRIKEIGECEIIENIEKTTTRKHNNNMRMKIYNALYSGVATSRIPEMIKR